MADINIVKYTSQSLTATIGDLATGNHGSSYTFWINDYQNNSYLSWGGDSNYKVVSNAEGPTFSYKGLLPFILTPENPSGNITSSTYVAYTYALFNTGLKSNYATSYFELRQHAIPKIDGTSYSVWVGDKVTLTYSFAYTPYNNEVKWGSSDDSLTLESYTGNTGTFLANSTLNNQYGYFTASSYAVSQDIVGEQSLTADIKLHNPIKDIVLCVSSYNGSYTYYHSNTSSSYTSTFKALAGSNISVNCYYVAAYNATWSSSSNTVAFNPFVTDAYIQGSSFTYTCNSGGGSYTASSSSSKKVFSIDLTNNKTGTYFNLNNIKYTTKVHFHTTTGTPTIEGVGKANALYSYYTNLNISLVNLSLTLDRNTVNPGDYVTLRLSTGGNDFGYVRSIDLIKYNPSASDTVITNFFTASDDETIEPQIKLNGGSKQLVIPSTVTPGFYKVKVTPKNGNAAYKSITIQEVTLLIDADEESLTAGDGLNNGHNYVDLGLPSGTKWATCNVGADLATSDGLLFQFGRTDGYAYGDINNKFIKGSANPPTTSGAEYGKGQILSLADDMVRANMGGDWIMPTKADLEELYDNTTRQVMTINGKKGMLFTSNINGKSIFVVFAGTWSYDDGQFSSRGSGGCLRSSEVGSSDATTAWYIDFYSIGDCDISYYARAQGYSVRGVLKP